MPGTSFETQAAAVKALIQTERERRDAEKETCQALETRIKDIFQPGLVPASAQDRQRALEPAEKLTKSFQREMPHKSSYQLRQSIVRIAAADKALEPVMNHDVAVAEAHGLFIEFVGRSMDRDVTVAELVTLGDTCKEVQGTVGNDTLSALAGALADVADTARLRLAPAEDAERRRHRGTYIQKANAAFTAYLQENPGALVPLKILADMPDRHDLTVSEMSARTTRQITHRELEHIAGAINPLYELASGRPINIEGKRPSEEPHYSMRNGDVCAVVERAVATPSPSSRRDRRSGGLAPR
jgi:hypothetical protein